MDEQERHKIKAMLIESGLWGANEPGDPTTDIHDAGKLNDRLQAKLGKDVFLVSEIAPDHLWTREVLIFHKHQTHKLASAPNYIEAMALAAVALPEFLRQHPECAADQK